MEKKIKVRIDKCSNPEYWYSQMIGQHIEVVKVSDKIYHTLDNMKGLHISDCIIIPDEVVEWPKVGGLYECTGGLTHIIGGASFTKGNKYNVVKVADDTVYFLNDNNDRHGITGEYIHHFRKVESKGESKVWTMDEVAADIKAQQPTPHPDKPLLEDYITYEDASRIAVIVRHVDDLYEVMIAIHSALATHTITIGKVEHTVSLEKKNQIEEILKSK